MSERLKFLMSALELKVGPFARIMGVSDTNIRNYLDRGSKPGAEFLEKLIRNFDTINPGWLLTGEGNPFLNDLATGQAAAINTEKKLDYRQDTPATSANSLAACQRALEAIRKDAASYQREIELLKEQIEDKKEIIALLHASTKHPR